MNKDNQPNSSSREHSQSSEVVQIANVRVGDLEFSLVNGEQGARSAGADTAEPAEASSDAAIVEFPAQITAAPDVQPQPEVTSTSNITSMADAARQQIESAFGEFDGAA